MPQFSLRNLLIFVFACCVYLAALPSMGAIWYAAEFPVDGIVVVSLVVAWLLLSLVYASWRLNNTLIVHFFCPIAATVIALIFFPIAGLPTDVNLRDLLVRILTVCCFISTFFSFPTTTLIIVVRAFHSKNSVAQKQGDPVGDSWAQE